MKTDGFPMNLLERREARGRLLLAANPWFQAVFTFSYWTDDTAWAVPIWERIVETIELGDGVPLETPQDHWSLRDASLPGQAPAERSEGPPASGATAAR